MRRLNLLSLLLAYALAAQGLLGFWVNASSAAGLAGFDPAFTLCRTINADAQPADPQTTSRQCAIMCLSGGPAATDIPPAIAVFTEFVPAQSLAAPFPERFAEALVLPRGFQWTARAPPLVG